MRRQFIAALLTSIFFVSLLALTAHATGWPLHPGQGPGGRPLGRQGPRYCRQGPDGVETGDVIRTNAGAKAQLSMVDASVITVGAGVRAWPSPIINMTPTGESAGPCCASSGAWCTPWSTVLSRPKSRISSWKPTPPPSGCEAPTGTRSWAPIPRGCICPGVSWA